MLHVQVPCIVFDFRRTNCCKVIIFLFQIHGSWQVSNSFVGVVFANADVLG